MVGGARGAVMGAIMTIGVICGTEYTMFMGAMIAGPLAGWVIKKFDKAVEGKIPSGFEMLVNNFSVGILGLLLAILGYYVIGPFMGGVLAARRRVPAPSMRSGNRRRGGCTYEGCTSPALPGRLE